MLVDDTTESVTSSSNSLRIIPPGSAGIHACEFVQILKSLRSEAAGRDACAPRLDSHSCLRIEEVGSLHLELHKYIAFEFSAKVGACARDDLLAASSQEHNRFIAHQLGHVHCRSKPAFALRG